MAYSYVRNENVKWVPVDASYKERKRAFYDNPELWSNELAICVVANNRIEKTKLCIESILKYTDCEYQLILVDNGSDDGTYEYFWDVPYHNKHVVNVEKNLGCNYALWFAQKHVDARYFCFVANDCIVTKNWISNLLTAIKSDRDIGMVSPVSCIISNNQEVYIGAYSSWDEMQVLAEKYNVSNPQLWEERHKLITVCALIRTECFDYIGKFFDVGIFHDYSDDDLSIRLARCGYKQILCKDTFVAHNHPMTERDGEWQRQSLLSGRNALAEKYRTGDTKDKKVFIVCPPGFATGGVELLHQLAFELNKNEHITAKLLYVCIDNPAVIQPKQYTDKYGTEYVVNTLPKNNSSDVIVFPEIMADMVCESFCEGLQKVIFWESVDNYRGDMSFKDVKGVLHLAQSEYARQWLIRQVGISSTYVLNVSDYLNDAYLDRYVELERENVVLYNPKKGMQFTLKLISSAPHITFVPILNMTTNEVIRRMRTAKVYIDFGNHPGKDRMPREAAICGCCVITGKNGSAAYHKDVPIPDKYKFERKDENIPAITKSIGNILLKYDTVKSDFDGYREVIRREKHKFEAACDALAKMLIYGV